ncbi:MAG: SDR family NAD(P)-dependent oxidoreductase [Candidatus Aminicenantaceae bacterium]
MTERIALVTGSSRGLGRDITETLAETASGVAVHYHQDRDAAGETVRNIEKKGTPAVALAADLTFEDEAARLVRETEDRFGRLDILVNNYGPILEKEWTMLTRADWDRILQTNLFSAWSCMQAALPGMRRREWGRIINIGYSRVEQLTAFQKILPYAVAKTGLLMLTRSAAVSEAGANITVNMVSPGLLEGGVRPKDPDIPAGRLGQFDDVAHAVRYLASPEAGYVTGINLVVAGGWKL